MLATVLLAWRIYKQRSADKDWFYLAITMLLAGIVWSMFNYSFYWGISDLPTSAIQHIAMGVLLLFGGLLGITSLHIRSKLIARLLKSVMPVALVSVAVLFTMHPQHMNGEDVHLLDTYHKVLAGVIVVDAALLVGKIWFYRPWQRVAILLTMLFISGLLLAYRHPAYAKATCDLRPRSEVILDLGNPSKIEAKLCQTLIIRNDNRTRYLVIGTHHHRQAYPGFKETILQPNQSTSLLLTQSGRYRIHDHSDHDSSFLVSIKPILQ